MTMTSLNEHRESRIDRYVRKAEEDKMDKPDLERRIDSLEDARVDRMFKQIEDLHKILLGNGSEGIIQKVAKNSVRIKIIFLILGGTLVGGGVGGIYGVNSKPSVPDPTPAPIISNVVTNN